MMNILKKALEKCCIGCVLMIIIYYLMSWLCGGDALSALHAETEFAGYVAGHYYLASQGNFVEVSYAMWLASMVVCVWIVAMFPFTAILAVVYGFLKKRQRKQEEPSAGKKP